MTSRYELKDLLYLMKRLRDPKTGCPWDIKQRFSSIVPHTIEEAYEVAEAIRSQDWPHLEEELGDLLFQVIFYSQLGSEKDLFDFSSVIDVLVTKLIRRHPHVFPGGNLSDQRDPEICLSDDEIKMQWQVIKQQEKELKALRSLAHTPINTPLPKPEFELVDYLQDIPMSLPALTQADKIQKKVSQRGFDWNDIKGVIDKVKEELREVEEEIEDANEERLTHEIGDLIFASVNLSRHLGINPEQALREANQRFSERYSLAAKSLSQKGRTLDIGNSRKVSAEEMELAWQDAKERHPQLKAQMNLAANDEKE